MVLKSRWRKLSFSVGHCKFLEFQQTTGNFLQRRLWVLRILIFVPNLFSKMKVFSPKFCIFRHKFYSDEKIFQQH